MTLQISVLAFVRTIGLVRIIVTDILVLAIILVNQRMVAGVQIRRIAKSVPLMLIAIYMATASVTNSGRDLSVRYILDPVILTVRLVADLVTTVSLVKTTLTWSKIT